VIRLASSALMALLAVAGLVVLAEVAGPAGSAGVVGVGGSEGPGPAGNWARKVGPPLPQADTMGPQKLEFFSTHSLQGSRTTPRTILASAIGASVKFSRKFLHNSRAWFWTSLGTTHAAPSPLNPSAPRPSTPLFPEDQ